MRRKLSVLVACMICTLSGAFVWLDAQGQEPGAGVIFFQHRQFNIPFKSDPKNGPIKQYRLYVSTDQGRSWQFTSTAAPEAKNFRFSTPQDGFFWFTVQTVDVQDRSYPATVEEMRPSLKVVVDATPPSVQVQPLPPRGGEVGVSWNVRDDNLDLSLPDAVQLKYRAQGGVSWTPLFVPPGNNQHFWNPQTNAAIEVIVQARDRAGNIGEDKTTVSLGGAGSGTYQPPAYAGSGRPPDTFNNSKNFPRKYVNSRQVALSYDLREVGPSGVSSVELWYTLFNDRSWTKLNEYPIDLKSGDQSKKLTFEVNEGVYGITLVAKSGVGLGDQPPRVGDPPQFWIEVDLTKPVVEIQNVIVGQGVDKGRLTVVWSARDQNLGPNPIRLSYAEQRDGPWNLCADNLANSGRHVWTMPGQLPYQFYLRVEAVDLAGNIGEAVTQDKVKVDLSVPKAKIINIESSGR